MENENMKTIEGGFAMPLAMVKRFGCRCRLRWIDGCVYFEGGGG